MRLVVCCCLLSLVAALAGGGTDGFGARAAGADDEVIVQKPEIAASLVAEPGKPVDPAAPRDAFHLLPGFQVERLFSVPKETHGSWASMTVDPKGRVIAAAEGKEGLYRITPPPIGSSEPTKVERLKVDVPSAQGLLFAFDSLYVTHNGSHSALYRLRDTNGDDQFDDVKRIKDLHGSGDHGPHATRVSPDGKQLYLIGGNHTEAPLAMSARPATADGWCPHRPAATPSSNREARAVSRRTGMKTCCCRGNGMPAATPSAFWRPAVGSPPPIPTARIGNF